MDGLPNEIDMDLVIYLPDLAPDQRFRFVGLNASKEIVSDASESPLVRLTRPLAGGGLVVSVEARPVFLPGAKPEEGALRFAPLETVTLLATSGPALEAARRFHRKNLDRIHQLLGSDVTPLPREMAHPAVHYDGRRQRLVISTSEMKHRRHTELSYVIDLHGRVEAVLGFSMFVAE
jgi:hypothetical protein